LAAALVADPAHDAKSSEAIMLEIILLIFLCRKIGNIVGPKGYNSGWFKFFAVIGWFGGEIGGGIIGAIIGIVSNRGGGEPPMGMIYICALVGAALGIGIVFWIANSLPQKAPPPLPYGYPQYGMTAPTETGNPYQPPAEK
jgi:hypothetical protein